MNKTLKCKAVQYYRILLMKNSYAAPLCLLKLPAPTKCSGGVLDPHSHNPTLMFGVHLHLKTFWGFFTPLKV